VRVNDIVVDNDIDSFYEEKISILYKNLRSRETYGFPCDPFP